MLTDACPSGNNRDVHQVEVPETAQFCPPCNGDVKGGAQLYGPAHAGRGRRLVGGINGVGDVFSPLDLRTEELKKLVCFTVDSSGELDLFHHLVCTVVQLLFGGDDAEQVQDESQQEHRNEDEHYGTEIVDIPMLIFQYGCRTPAGSAFMGRGSAGCFGHCLGQSKTTTFLTKTAVSLDGKRLLYIFLTVPSIAWMPLRGKSRTVPMLCRWCANLKVGRNLRMKSRRLWLFWGQADKQIVIFVFLW